MFTAVKLALIVASSNNMSVQTTRDASTDALIEAADDTPHAS
jgi:hypothetical protein